MLTVAYQETKADAQPCILDFDMYPRHAQS